MSFKDMPWTYGSLIMELRLKLLMDAIYGPCWRCEGMGV